MYIAMNRFLVKPGHEEAFENVWKSRKSTLSEMKGFQTFHLLRSAYSEEKGSTLFASHTVWDSEADFVAWTKSENFRDSHKNAGTSKLTTFGHPQFEGFSTVEGA